MIASTALAFTAVPGPSEPAGGEVEVISFERSGRAKHAATLTVKAASCKTGQELVRVIEVSKAGQSRLHTDSCT